MANPIAQSNVAQTELLARALQGLRPASVPTIKLGRFTGHHQRSGDPTLADWLDDFIVYVWGVSYNYRAVVQFDHLGRCAKAFRAKLAARVQLMSGVYLYTQPINHPRFICSDGCHLTDKGVQKYGEGIWRAVG